MKINSNFQKIEDLHYHIYIKSVFGQVRLYAEKKENSETKFYIPLKEKYATPFIFSRIKHAQEDDNFYNKALAKMVEVIEENSLENDKQIRSKLRHHNF